MNSSHMFSKVIFISVVFPANITVVKSSRFYLSTEISMPLSQFPPNKINVFRAHVIFIKIRKVFKIKEHERSKDPLVLLFHKHKPTAPIKICLIFKVYIFYWDLSSFPIMIFAKIFIAKIYS